MLLAVATVEDMSEWAPAIGAALKEALGERTQKWLATQMGVDPSTVSRLLAGSGSPTVDHIAKAADALGISRRRLLARAGYLSERGTVDLDALPADVRRGVVALLREFGQEVSTNGDHGSDAGS